MVDKIKDKYLSLSEEERNKFVNKLKNEGERYGVFPLSSLQDTLLYAYLTDKKDTSYNIRMKLRFSEQLQVDSLKKSLDYVVAVNASLRSKLLILEEEYFQVVEKPYSVQIPVMEVDSFENDGQLQASDRVFDLEKEYPIRFQLIKDVSKKEYVLVLTAHHIFTDGWSFEILVNEIKEKYIEICDDKSGKVQNRIKKRSYAEIYLDRDVSEASERYWEKYLKDGIYKVNFREIKNDFMAEYLVNETKTVEKCKNNRTVTLDEKKTVEELSARYSVSPYAVLLSVYLDALHQLSNRENVSTAIAVLNRNTKEELESVGLYATLLPIISNLHTETIEERLEKVKKDIRNSITYGNMDQRKLINLLMSQNTSSEMYSNVFLFSEQSREREMLGNTDVWVTSENIDNSRNVQYDILCSINLSGEYYELSMDYRKEEISEKRIAEFENLYLQVFNGYVEGVRNVVLESNRADRVLASRNENTALQSERCEEEKEIKCVKELSDIWEKLLGHNEFEQSDNFFTVGGNSLLAIKLMKQINESFDVNLKITDIFKYHSLIAMAKHLAALDD